MPTWLVSGNTTQVWPVVEHGVNTHWELVHCAFWPATHAIDNSKREERSVKECLKLEGVEGVPVALQGSVGLINANCAFKVCASCPFWRSWEGVREGVGTAVAV